MRLLDILADTQLSEMSGALNGGEMLFIKKLNWIRKRRSVCMFDAMSIVRGYFIDEPCPRYIEIERKYVDLSFWYTWNKI